MVSVDVEYAVEVDENFIVSGLGLKNRYQNSSDLRLEK